MSETEATENYIWQPEAPNMNNGIPPSKQPIYGVHAVENGVVGMIKGLNEKQAYSILKIIGKKTNDK